MPSRGNHLYSGRVIGRVSLILAMGLAVANLLCGAAKRRFTVADDIGVAHFGDPYTVQADPVTFSPDARYFVVDTERGLLGRNRCESTLRIYRADDVLHFLRTDTSGQPLALWTFRMSTYKYGPIITHIPWLSDSHGIAFLANTG